MDKSCSSELTTNYTFFRGKKNKLIFVHITVQVLTGKQLEGENKKKKKKKYDLLYIIKWRGFFSIPNQQCDRIC